MATTYNYAPLFRSSVGFDRIFDLLENAQRGRSISDWPPYDIIKTGDDSYRITIAVAGFAQDDLDITFQWSCPQKTGHAQV
jgi:molecular chaperone IbpA